ncbi:MAG: multidrug transporter, partial [Paraburkholderia fungorum]
LFTTPVIYLGFDALARRVRERFNRGNPVPPATDAGN